MCPFGRSIECGCDVTDRTLFRPKVHVRRPELIPAYRAKEAVVKRTRQEIDYLREVAAVLRLKLNHVAVYTRDIERSLRFYTAVLQAKVLWNGESELPAGKIRAAMLEIGDFQLELVVPLPSYEWEGQKGTIQHIALTVASIRDVESIARETGLVEKMEPTSRLIAFGKTMDHAFIYGPDGERIELVEEL